MTQADVAVPLAVSQAQVSRRPHGDGIVRAWAAGDEAGLDDAGTDQIVDLGSQWGQYEYVTNVGFAAQVDRGLGEGVDPCELRGEGPQAGR